MFLEYIMQLIFRQFFNLKYPKYQATLAITCVVLFVVPALLLKSNFSKKSHAPTWQDASDIAPPSLVKKALSFDSTGRIDDKSIKVMQIPSQGSGHLYIFDFRSPQLCGVGGCVYLVYHESGKLLLQLIANPNLPPKEELFRTSDTVINGFPCLVVTQTTATENMVSHTQYCYQSGRFVRLNEAFSTVGQDFLWGEEKR
jgi:hypothetical protein